MKYIESRKIDGVNTLIWCNDNDFENSAEEGAFVYIKLDPFHSLFATIVEIGETYICIYEPTFRETVKVSFKCIPIMDVIYSRGIACKCSLPHYVCDIPGGRVFCEDCGVTITPIEALTDFEASYDLWEKQNE